MTILHITNGDSAANIMQEAGISGDILSWRDVLYEGPVPAGLSLKNLSDVRARYLSSRNWSSTFEQIRDSFKDRDERLSSFDQYEKIVLWFEHDLYDQLQILQILNWFSEQDPGKKTLKMICVDRYLGLLTPAEMAALVNEEKEVTRAQLKLAKKAWKAFCAASHLAFQDLLNEDTQALPYLEGAIKRLLEEYPDYQNGLSRTAKQALLILASGPLPPGQCFGKYMETEERRFLGDSSFWDILREMLESEPPLLSLPENIKLALPSTPDQLLTITQTGKDVLQGKQNWLDIKQIDRWIGGVHLVQGNIWQWNPQKQVLEPVSP